MEAEPKDNLPDCIVRSDEGIFSMYLFKHRKSKSGRGRQLKYRKRNDHIYGTIKHSLQRPSHFLVFYNTQRAETNRLTYSFIQYLVGTVICC